MCTVSFEVASLGFLVPPLISSLRLQVLAFVTISALRSFSFAVIFNSVNMLFGVKHFGILSGIALTVGGVTTLLQVRVQCMTLTSYCSELLYSAAVHRDYDVS